MAASGTTSNLSTPPHAAADHLSAYCCSNSSSRSNMRRIRAHYGRRSVHSTSSANPLSASSPFPPFASSSSSSSSSSAAASASSFEASSRMSLSSMASDHNYTTLGVPVGASEEQIKRARRKLALKFHPDVCKEESCAARFIQIERAYETIMKCVRGSITSEPAYDDGMMGVNNDSWEDWEEWMGWEGAGTRDYSSHINPSF